MQKTRKRIALKKKRLILIWIVGVAIVLLMTSEVIARAYFGLGNPPLSMTHPTIEYMYRPNQDVYRFGNHFMVNQYGMRSIPFTHTRQNGEFRIMVFGDSVVNGGALTDQADIATSLLQDSLTKSGYKRAIVGNISAGSWGPGNWLAYAKEYGFFDADITILVLSSHDYADNPTFEPLNPNTHPTTTPISALFEGLSIYLPRYLPQLNYHPITNETDRPSEMVTETGGEQGIADLKNFLKLAQQHSKKVYVFQHLEYLELKKHQPNIGYQRIQEACKQLNIVPISLEPYFRMSLESGVNPYRDNIHPNQIGQQIISTAITVNLPSSTFQTIAPDLRKTK